jgi:hypothetical protein
VGFHNFIKTKSNLINLEPWKKPLGMPSMYMIKEKKGHLSKMLRMIIREAIWIKGRRDSSHLSSEIYLKHIN